MTMDQDLLCLIYELLNQRDLTPEMEIRVKQELELHGCCESRIEFERFILMRFRKASQAESGCCPDRLKKKIMALLEEL
jgi:hypothetical protein